MEAHLPDLAQLGPRPEFARGLCTSRELQLLGIGERAAADLVSSGALVRLRRGCFATRQEAAPREQVHEQDTAARLLNLRGHAWRSYSALGGWNFAYASVSAALLHGLALWTPERRLHVVQAFASSSGDHAADVVKAQRAPLDVESVTGMPVIPVADAVVDCLRILGFESAMIVCESALARGLGRDELNAALERAAGRRGIGRARSIAASASSGSESPAETRARLLLLALTLSAGLPVQQFWVTVAGRRFRLDNAWPDLMVALEVDGLVKYVGPAQTAEVIRAEREREKALANAGWTIVRITWSDLDQPRKVEAMLAHAFERARRMRAA
ncbi:type IV toxin-antitoxin system AbiEi family antitoxin domain-containing protein [Sinomonas halotolerans]|uniref:Type IV toxin-antitoxin system AbiEi family antitoxin domain-containing protein n=1 Tax=Sinomonas halotolerans TaxID=1644133 RepID=A0ABU9WWI0_9MICC